MRWRPTALLAALALASCSNGASGQPATTPIVPPAPTTPEVRSGQADAGETATKAASTEPVESVVALTASATGFDRPDLDLVVEASASGSGDAGPFDEFGSCSGLRDFVGAYSVFASGPQGVVSVWTADRVTAGGIYDAEVRLESTGDPLVASGTLTVLDDLQTGTFLAFGADGGRVEGTFDCVGAPTPAPLALGDVGDGVLDAVEVFALIRVGEAERVVGLAVDGSGSVDCPAASSGEAGPLILRVDGDAGLGAITTFELSGEPTVTARLRVGGASYEFTDVAVTVESDGTSGIFSATSGDGTSVDGAFRCT